LHKKEKGRKKETDSQKKNFRAINLKAKGLNSYS
jgi:hypothetical protein